MKTVPSEDGNTIKAAAKFVLLFVILRFAHNKWLT